MYSRVEDDNTPAAQWNKNNKQIILRNKFAFFLLVQENVFGLCRNIWSTHATPSPAPVHPKSWSQRQFLSCWRLADVPEDWTLNNIRQMFC